MKQRSFGDASAQSGVAPFVTRRREFKVEQDRSIATSERAQMHNHPRRGLDQRIPSTANPI